MSRFYGSVGGSAGTLATRCGTVNSGISGHIRGWNVGVSVDGMTNNHGEDDVFFVYATGGSNGSSPRTLLGVVMLADGIPTFTPEPTA